MRLKRHSVYKLEIALKDPFLHILQFVKKLFSFSPTFPNLKGTKKPLYGYSWPKPLALYQLANFSYFMILPFANALKCIFLSLNLFRSLQVGFLLSLL